MKQKIKRKLYGGRIISSFILALIIFSSVFMFGYIVSKDRYDQNYYEQQKILRSYLTLQVEKDILQESCNSEAIQLSAKDLDELGYFITILEDKLGFNDENLLSQKNDYYLLETQHMLLVQEQNKNCIPKQDIILFFYSNDKSSVDRAEEIGFILSTAKKERQDIMVYSFDYDADYSLIHLLKREYNINSPNSVVVNNRMSPPIGNIRDIRKILEETQVERQNSDGLIRLN